MNCLHAKTVVLCKLHDPQRFSELADRHRVAVETDKGAKYKFSEAISTAERKELSTQERTATLLHQWEQHCADRLRGAVLQRDVMKLRCATLWSGSSREFFIHPSIHPSGGLHSLLLPWTYI